MARIAVLSPEGRVTNVVVGEPEQMNPAFGQTGWRELPEDSPVAIGDRWNGEAFEARQEEPGSPDVPG